MLRTRVKICGITRIEDAVAAVNCGADALGFVFVKASKRYVDPEVAEEIARKLPSFISKVALVMDPSETEIEHIHSNFALDFWQFHGRESLLACENTSETTRKPYIKGLPVGGLSSEEIKRSIQAYPSASGLLVDGHAAGKLGGSGEKADWDLLVNSLSQADIAKLILAGGLSPDNITTALAKIQPYAIDLSSGVEQSPGIKSVEKIQSLFEQVLQSDLQRAVG